jgi:hypothetical protein
MIWIRARQTHTDTIRAWRAQSAYKSFFYLTLQTNLEYAA